MNSIYPEDFPTEKYLLNSEMTRYKHRVILSEGIIREALSIHGNWYVAWSGGKDSTVLAHLVNTIIPGMAIWTCRDNADFPGLHEYIRATAVQYSFNLDFCDTGIDAFEFIKQNRVNIFEDMNNRNTIVGKMLFFDLVKKQESKYNGAFIGLRNDESKARLWNYKSKTALYRRKDGFYICNPLSLWSATDIFSYLVSNNIPVFDVYFKTKFVEMPENIRMDWSLPGNFANSGFCVWLKYYYPELYIKYIKLFPEVKCYV